MPTLVTGLESLENLPQNNVYHTLLCQTLFSKSFSRKIVIFGEKICLTHSVNVSGVELYSLF